VQVLFAIPGRAFGRAITALMEGRSRGDLAMDRYAAGDDAAFAVVYDEVAPRVYGFLLRQTRDAALAEDVVQQTMLQMHRARATFLEGAPVLPWALAIARRLAVDAHRRRRREVLSAQPQEDIAGPADDGEARAVAAQTAARLRAELDRLPEAQRVAFQLVKDEGLSMAEAAAVLGTTVMAVKLRAHRAYQALRAALGEDAGDAPKGGDP
jgi:RNA polymerase sigma-70 factor (ECF subfamily)